jgi:hypothetical protein
MKYLFDDKKDILFLLSSFGSLCCSYWDFNSFPDEIPDCPTLNQLNAFGFNHCTPGKIINSQLRRMTFFYILSSQYRRYSQ